MKWRVVATVALALTVPAAAAAGEVRTDKLTRAVQLASGRPSVDASCEPDITAWDAEARARGISGDKLYGYTLRENGRVRLAPWVCENLTPSSPRFGWALHVVAGEAGRAAGIHDDGLDGCFGLLWISGLARTWGVPIVYMPGGTSPQAAAAYAQTPLLSIVAQALDFHRRGYAPQYRTLCD